MPIRRTVQAYQAASPFEQAVWTLAAVPAALLTPLLLQWIFRGIADAGRGQAGFPAAATRMTLHAMEQLVHWTGVGVLGALAAGCAALAAAYLLDTRDRATGVPPWAVAEAYAVGAVAALAGLLWLL